METTGARATIWCEEREIGGKAIAREFAGTGTMVWLRLQGAHLGRLHNARCHVSGLQTTPYLSGSG